MMIIIPKPLVSVNYYFEMGYSPEIHGNSFSFISIFFYQIDHRCPGFQKLIQNLPLSRPKKHHSNNWMCCFIVFDQSFFNSVYGW